MKRKAEEESPATTRAKALWQKVLSLLRAAKKENTRQVAEAMRDSAHYNYQLLERELMTTTPFIERFWQDEEGNTLTHYAARLGFENRIRQLVSLGSPRLVLNKAGETPGDVYLKSGHSKLSIQAFLKPNWVDRRITWRERITLPSGSPPLRYPSAALDARIHPGRFVTQDLTLYFVKKRIICPIPDRSHAAGDPLSLHDRMKMETHRRGSSAPGASDNLVMATLGLIVSTKPHAEKGRGDYGLQFINLPINHPVDAVHAVKDERDPVHSERQLYQYLANRGVLENLLREFERLHRIQNGFKIYGVVLDLYSNREMCGNCEEATYDQTSSTPRSSSAFLELFENLCREKGYPLPKPKTCPPDALTPTRRYSLHFAPRVSYSQPYERGTPEDSIGALYPTFEERLPLTSQARNIKRFRNSVILLRRLGQPQTAPSLPTYQAQTLFQNTYPTRAFSPVKRDSLDKT